MEQQEFFEQLFQTAPGKAIIFRAIPPKKSFTTLTDVIELPKFNDKSNWYFSVCPHEEDDKVRTGVAVWCDIDGTQSFREDQARVAPPSAIVRTGHGVHVYYIFDQLQSVSDTKHLVRLAQVCLGGDKNAMDPTRLLRVPGTMNVKKSPALPCELVKFRSARYKPEKVEEMLLAALLVSLWVEGLRNQNVMGFASVMARAGWTVARVEKVIKLVCQSTGDKDLSNRLQTVRITFDKYLDNQVTSSKGLAETMGATQFRALVGVVGCDILDGEVKYGDQVIGTQQTIQQDMVNFVLGDPDTREWGWQEGQLVRWNGRYWCPAEKSTLTSKVFEIMEKSIVSKGGVEKRFPAKYSVADGAAKLVTGHLACDPMEPHDPDIIGLKNGVLNLITGEFRDFKRTDRLRRLLPVEFDPSAKCPLWTKFLREAQPEFVKNKGDKEFPIVNFLKQWVGYCFIPGNYFQRMLWCYGPSNTGKSTFLVTLFYLFGPTAVTISSQNISQYQIATLAGANIAVCTELSTQRFRTATFKALTAGDPVVARHPYGRPFPLQFDGKFMFGSNSLPVIDEVEGMWKRLIILPFNHPPQRVDTTLMQKLKETELSGIFNWAWEGCQEVRELQRDGHWDIPDVSVETVAHYMQYANLMDIFIKEEMKRGQDCSCTVQEVFNRFVDYSRGMGHPGLEFGAWFIEEFRRRDYRIEDMKIYGIELGSINSLKWGVKGL